MQKQKRGFWLFIFSLIPGAGELYMGFKKQGISTMLLFFAIIAAGASTGMDWLIWFLPIVWFYSFFNVHNLKSLTEEEFYSVEDSYVLHLDQIIGDADGFLEKYRVFISVLLIIFGVSIVWNNFTDILYWILPGVLADIFGMITYSLPQIVIGVLILLAGLYLLSNRNKNKEEGSHPQTHREKNTSYQPHRHPYRRQQTQETPAPAPAYSPFYMPTQSAAPVSPDTKETDTDTSCTAESPLDIPEAPAAPEPPKPFEEKTEETPSAEI